MALRGLRIGLRRLFKNDAFERELSDEVAHYLEMSIADHMRRGLSRDEAERAARREFGSIDAAKEQVRDGGWEHVVETLWQDIRYGFRGLGRSPMFTVTVLVTLALGIGANAAMFSVVNGVMLRPLPYHDAGRLVLLWTDDLRRGLHNEPTAYPTILDWQRQATTVEAIGYFNAGRVTLAKGAYRERSRLASTSSNLFWTIGAAPALGPGITEADGRTGALVAVISDGLWRRYFSSDPDVIGKSLELDYWQSKGERTSFTVVGVMAPDFYFPDRQTEIWVPATTSWRWARDSTERFEDWARSWTGVARLAPAASVADARAEFSRIGGQLSAVHRSPMADFPGFAVNVVPILDYIAGPGLQLSLWVLLGAVGLVLLVACANVGNLLLARGTARRHEIAMRRALGATRLRLVRQLFVESLVLAFLAGVAGILIAAGATRVLAVAAIGRLPRVDQITIDLRVLLFTVAVSIVAGALFGLLPAMRVTGSTAAGWLKDAAAIGGGPRIRRTRGFLVVVECCAAVVLLVGAGLLLRSLTRVRAIEPGFDAAHVLLVRVEFPRDVAAASSERSPSSGPPGARARLQSNHDLIERLIGVAGIEAAGFIDDMFVTGRGNKTIAFPGRDALTFEAGELNEGAVSPEFFATMRVPLRRGRYLSQQDAITKLQALSTPIPGNLALPDKVAQAIAEPVVVNDAFVARYLRNAEPIGQRFCIDPENKTYCYEIVGVVGDMHRQGPERAAIPEYFGPLTPSPTSRADLAVRTHDNPVAAAAVVRELVNAALPGALVPEVLTADAGFGAFTAQRNFNTSLLTLFAALAVALAAIGIYGIVHYAVAQRTREIGVRVALGARPRDVVGLVIRSGMQLPLAGIALGLVVSFALTRVMSHLLFEIRSTDGITFAAVGITLAAAALAACYVPARRAARLDAVTALRLE